MTEQERKNKAIVSLAILKTNYDTREIKGKKLGYLENFVLLIINLVNHKKYENIDLNDLSLIQAEFLEYYGLRIPIMVLRTILAKAKRLGFFTQDHQVLRANYTNIEQMISGNTEEESRREIERLFLKIKKFSNKKYQLKLTSSEIEESLINILNRHSLDILYFYDEINHDIQDLLPRSSKDNASIEFIIYKFIKKIEKKDNDLYKIIEKIAVGYALLSAVMYSGEKFQEGKIKKINIFLDTRPILRLLGIEGERQQENYLEFLEFVANHSKEINIFVLDKHYDEIVHIFEQAKISLSSKNIDFNKISNATRYFIDSSFTPSDVDELIGSLESKMNKLGIERFTKFDYDRTQYKYQIDEPKLEKEIANKYGKLDNMFSLTSSKKEAIAVDAAMIAQVMTLKGRRIYRNFSEIEYLFVTSNIALALAVKDFEKEEFDINSGFIPTCVTDFFFFTLLWVNSDSNQVNGDGIDTKIITRTLLAFNPDKKLYEKYYDQLKTLKERGDVTDDDYILLCSRQAIESMEEHTIADCEKINAKLPFEIISEIKNEAHQKYLEEKNKHAVTETNLKKELAVQNSRVESIAKKIFWFIEAIFIFLGISFLYFSFDNILSTINGKSPNIIGVIFLGIVGIFGFSIIDFFRTKSFILVKIRKFLWRFLYGK